jgi:hypothetical protein
VLENGRTDHEPVALSQTEDELQPMFDNELQKRFALVTIGSLPAFTVFAQIRIFPQCLTQRTDRAARTHDRNPFPMRGFPKSLHDVMAKKIRQQNEQIDALRNPGNLSLVAGIPSTDMRHHCNPQR